MNKSSQFRAHAHSLELQIQATRCAYSASVTVMVMPGYEEQVAKLVYLFAEYSVLVPNNLKNPACIGL